MPRIDIFGQIDKYYAQGRLPPGKLKTKIDSAGEEYIPTEYQHLIHRYYTQFQQASNLGTIGDKLTTLLDSIYAYGTSEQRSITQNLLLQLRDESKVEPNKLQPPSPEKLAIVSHHSSESLGQAILDASYSSDGSRFLVNAHDSAYIVRELESD